MLLNEFNKISDSNVDDNRDSTRKMLTFSDIAKSVRPNLEQNYEDECKAEETFSFLPIDEVDQPDNNINMTCNFGHIYESGKINQKTMNISRN